VFKELRLFIDGSILSFFGRIVVIYFLIYSAMMSVAGYYYIKEYERFANKVVAIADRTFPDDIEGVCKVVNCISYTKDGKFVRVAANDTAIEKIANRFFSARIELEDGSEIVVSIKRQVELFTILSIALYAVALIMIMLFFADFVVYTGIRKLVTGASATASLHNKNMSMLAEQLHHELNTPLNVIKELCDEMMQLTTCAREKGQPPSACMVALNRDKLNKMKRMIDDNLSQALVVIRRMADAKQIRYSNGDKSIYDISKAAFDAMHVFKTSAFSYVLDPALKKYKIDHTTGLQNHEFMNILFNHIKNSIDADADTIDLSLNSVRDEINSKVAILGAKLVNKIPSSLPEVLKVPLVFSIDKIFGISRHRPIKFAYITLADNGVGVPQDVVPRIFELHYSTKSKNGEIRGAGLYLNREILRSAGGDLFLYKTSPKGTVFVLKVPVADK